jgi:hypothetical protein
MSVASKNDDQYMLRLPDGLRERIKRHATINGRSLNTEIVDAIERHLERTNRLDEFEQRLTRLEQHIQSRYITKS